MLCPAYERGKTHLPWNPADVPPPTYVKQFDVSRKSREMDPVLMRHRFLEKHEERMTEEKRFLRERAEEKYRRTHDYNIIAGAYYDQDKERKFVNSRDKLLTMQGRAQQYRLPPSIRYGEGNGYNIINQQPKKTVVDMTSASVQDRGLSKRTRGRQTYEDNIRQHERAAAASEQRTLNRPSHMRHVEVLRTGHNVISNQDFAGREGKPPPQPRAKPPMPVWDRLKGKHEMPEAAAIGSMPTAETNDGGQQHGDVTGLGQTNSRDAGGSSGRCGGQVPASPGGARGTEQPGTRREAPPPLREGSSNTGGRIDDHGGETNRGIGGRPSAEAAMPSTKPAVPPLNLSRS
ncbi:conserved unknown protein [Ectocarpus siliculosus]|uniref:Uncharacterized protein n=1 Tax=Ectocarpus siliculosus TaxID=2880 RepID=D8LS80_ECTSI|nr:conserved unknown protein [Ectocarpus siliculosus]|eukprot:CBN75137.1 conserved unknown protein [Ectocarpus siliculosus]